MMTMNALAIFNIVILVASAAGFAVTNLFGRK